MKQCCFTCEHCDIDPISPIKVGMCQITDCETKSSSGSRCRDYLPKDMGACVVVGVRISVPTYRLIEIISEKEKRTESSIIEDAVHMYISEKGKKDDKQK